VYHNVIKHLNTIYYVRTKCFSGSSTCLY